MLIEIEPCGERERARNDLGCGSGATGPSPSPLSRRSASRVLGELEVALERDPLASVESLVREGSVCEAFRGEESLSDFCPSRLLAFAAFFCCVFVKGFDDSEAGAGLKHIRVFNISV